MTILDVLFPELYFILAIGPMVAILYKGGGTNGK
jgi:hypothetical protein